MTINWIIGVCILSTELVLSGIPGVILHYFILKIIANVFIKYLTLGIRQSDCGAPGYPHHGNISSVSGDQVKYRCDNGYVMIGNISRHCSVEDNKWSGHVPLCSKSC